MRSPVNLKRKIIYSKILFVLKQVLGNFETNSIIGIVRGNPFELWEGGRIIYIHIPYLLE